ncbi:hypothetical protein QYE76_006126 [Lolium multiflorum]|uniref:CCHC-type domain-containing protein n=1 Tax=Lolium multiflorum TaxID=4521 RepID=A0AAD8RXP6_LOLMU|nr:hypothetical protein QYE76_006126 [Lolium multiflorum]
MNGGQFMTWEDFKLKFSKYHVPPGLIKKMRDEFRELKQGRMTVVEYHDKFLTLSRYAPDETDTVEKRKERFLNGLHDEMQIVLVNIPFADLEALVDSAIEGKLNQANENRKRRMMNQKLAPGYQNRSGGNSKPGGYNNNNYNNNNANTAPRTGSNAVPVATKDKATITCYECGVVGHYSNECPKRLAKLAGNTAAPAQQQRRVSTGKKFAPNNPNNRNGRLYHMNAEEAREADVVLGFLASIELQPTLVSQIKEAQKDNASIDGMKKQIAAGKAPGFTVDEAGVLWYKESLCEPSDSDLKQVILQEAHDTLYSIHPGGTKMYQDLKEQFWWHGMKREIGSYIAKCDICQRVKANINDPPIATTSPIPNGNGTRRNGLYHWTAQIQQRQ